MFKCVNVHVICKMFSCAPNRVLFEPYVFMFYIGCYYVPEIVY